MVLSYYNSANPAQPFSGPSNSGSSNYTQRLCRCSVALKAGAAASTGTQTTPSPDSGYVGLFAITVANGQTQITSSSIAQLATAPFFPALPAVPAGRAEWVVGLCRSGYRRGQCLRHHVRLQVIRSRRLMSLAWASSLRR